MEDTNWQKIFGSYSFFVEFYTEDEVYVAKCMEYPVLQATGPNREEAIKNVQKQLVPKLDAYKTKNGNYPEPVVKEGYKEGPFVREIIRKGKSVVETPAPAPATES